MGAQLGERPAAVPVERHDDLDAGDAQRLLELDVGLGAQVTPLGAAQPRSALDDDPLGGTRRGGGGGGGGRRQRDEAEQRGGKESDESTQADTNAFGRTRQTLSLLWGISHRPTKDPARRLDRDRAGTGEAA
jgi:hypothetical protein